MTWSTFADFGNRRVGGDASLWYALPVLEGGLTIGLLVTAAMVKMPRPDELLALTVWGHAVANMGLLMVLVSYGTLTVGWAVFLAGLLLGAVGWRRGFRLLGRRPESIVAHDGEE